MNSRIVSKSGEDKKVDEASMIFLAQKKKGTISFTDDSAIIKLSDGIEFKINRDSDPSGVAIDILRKLGYEID